MINRKDAEYKKLRRLMVFFLNNHLETIKTLSTLKELEQDFVPEIHDALAHKIVRHKSFSLKPMTTEDAIDELELTDHSFYVFLNKATNIVCVLYVRTDGDYGLIEAVV